MIRRPPRSTLFPYTTPSDLHHVSAPVCAIAMAAAPGRIALVDRKSTRLNSSHMSSSYAVFCLKKKTRNLYQNPSSGGGSEEQLLESAFDKTRERLVGRRPIHPLTRLRFAFFFNDTATTEIYTLSLHDALPI